MQSIFIDLAPEPTPFWMLIRPSRRSATDISGFERKCAKAVGVAYEDYGVGLCYESKDDAERVRASMIGRRPRLEISAIKSTDF